MPIFMAPPFAPLGTAWRFPANPNVASGHTKDGNLVKPVYRSARLKGAMETGIFLLNIDIAGYIAIFPRILQRVKNCARALVNENWPNQIAEGSKLG
ncbi:hypothetical protein P6U16_08990 [Rhizobium sp. 32-5/1]|uniref:hypothetical protein n=1 Tax=Rhizobium sp. 32-5/1 TaxID=3019602 RepID=UPI00240D8D69|nr:hypothetical protein [Rhizobium sp. 32-5/1]WEZ84682.1 hypothetical protein P6U16_08990 [Rhizobium sp. 32-5/1]